MKTEFLFLMDMKYKMLLKGTNVGVYITSM